MKELKHKTAVITGAASGIGRALADRFVSEGMKVVLADVEEGPLLRAEAELRSSGADVLAVLTDVSRSQDVDALAHKTISKYGSVHVLCKNAGVGGDLAWSWEHMIETWFNHPFLGTAPAALPASVTPTSARKRHQKGFSQKPLY